MTDRRPELDPQVAEFAARLGAAWAQFPDLASRPYPEQRAAAEAVRRPWRSGGPELQRRELVAPTPAGDVRVRLYGTAAAGRPAPVLVYNHGGGFTTFSLDTHDRIMREYAMRGGLIVAGVDYALSPEAKFPTALDQVAGVIEWLQAWGPELGLDPARIAVGGDSAGANLALSAAIALRDRGRGELIKALVLAYGFFDDETSSPSHEAFGQPGALLSSEELVGFAENYVGGTGFRTHPLAFPARAELHDLPPSFHLIAECDPLADSDRAMAAKLAASGNVVETRVYAGATHSFLEAVSIAPLAEQALQDSAGWLAAQLDA
jgi:acetyl esterase